MSAPPSANARSRRLPLRGQELAWIDEGKDDSTQSGQQAPSQSELAPLIGCRALGDFPTVSRNTASPMGTLMKNTSSPGTILANQPPSTGPDCRGNGGEPGLGSDRSAAVVLSKISADQRQTAGDEQCSTNPSTPLATISHQIAGEQPVLVCQPLAVDSGATVRESHPLPFSPAVTG
jgi:hypothetical protein